MHEHRDTLSSLTPGEAMTNVVNGTSITLSYNTFMVLTKHLRIKYKRQSHRPVQDGIAALMQEIPELAELQTQ